MRWLKSYPTLRDHPKTRKLARRVGGLPVAIGTLHCLWWWCMDYAPDGDLTKHDHEDIAVACGWEGDSEEIIRHLVECGFLDNGNNLRVHDWAEWGGKWVTQQVAAAERSAEYYAKKKAADAGTMRSLCVDNAKSTDPEEKRREEKKSTSVVTKNVTPSYSGEFEEWWVAYGRKGSKAEAFTLYRHWRKQASAEDLLAAANNYRASFNGDRLYQWEARRFLARAENRWEEWVCPSPNGDGNKSEIDEWHALTGGAK